MGDDEAVALAAREPFVRFGAADDRPGKMAALADLARTYVPQTLPIIGAFAAAAAVDPEVSQAWEEYEGRRRQDARILVASLEPWLRNGIDVETATDIFWSVFSHAPVEALMGRAGWTLDRYVDFLVDAVQRLLLE